MKKWLCLILTMMLGLMPLAEALGEADQIVDLGSNEIIEAGSTDASDDLSVLEEGELDVIPVTDPGAPLEQQTLEISINDASVEEEADDAQEEQAESEEAEPELVLNFTDLTLGMQEKFTGLKATLTGGDSDDAITWSSSKKTVAKVDKTTGVITALKKKGTTQITATSSTGLQATCTVKVRKLPDKVTMSAKTLSLSVGQTGVLTATLPSGTGSSLKFTSGNNKVAKVDSLTGEVKAVAPGTATITVKTCNKKKATCKVTVTAAPAQVFLPSKLTVARYQHSTVKATAKDADGNATEATYTFSAEDGTGSVTVDPQTGEVVGETVGTAKILVTTHNGVSTHLSKGKSVRTVCKVAVIDGPAAVELSASNVTIGKKQKFNLDPVFLAEDGSEMSDVTYTVSSSASKKLKVSANGVVTGLKTGTFQATVTAFNGISAACTVKVVDAPTKVKLTPSSADLELGASLQLKTSFNSGAMASCTYTSSDETVAVVDDTGMVTALHEGSCTITVKTHNGKKAKASVTVTAGDEFLVLTGDYSMQYDEATGTYLPVYPKTVRAEETCTLECRDASVSIIDCTSSNKSVATVTDSGVITALAPGQADIWVEASNGLYAIARVFVPGTVKGSIRFESGEYGLKVGQTIDVPALKGTGIVASALADAEYKSEDESVLIVKWVEADQQWRMTGVEEGTVTLTASAGGVSCETTVIVEGEETASSIAFEVSRVYMQAGQSWTPTVLDDCGREVEAEYTSSKKSVVTVDTDGVVTAVAKGSAKITARYGDLTATVTVVVKAETAVVTLDVNALDLAVGDKHRLEVSVNGNGTSSRIDYASSDPSVATVSSGGLIVGRGTGTAVVTVTEAGGASATCQVTVYAPPTHLTVDPASVSQKLKKGGIQLSWSFGSSDEVGSVSFSSSNPRVVTVSAKGYVTYKSVGDAVITVTTDNGLSVMVDVTVLDDSAASKDTTYRLFAAYSYYDSLPFTKRNAEGMKKVFAKSEMNGKGYSTKVMGNPSKSALLSGISSFFADAKDDDVSIVYLCAHGHNDKSDYSDYYLSLSDSSGSSKAKYKVTSSEIFKSVKAIRGNVVLILDSCYSGTFIQDMSSKLKAEDGRIAVMTAASNTRATYYNQSPSVDFFTFFLLKGLGYNERDGWWNKNASGSEGSYPGYLAADKAGNGDGVVTVGEMYNYAANCIDENIPGYMKKSWYWGDRSKVQKTRLYAGSLRDLPLYQAG